MLSASSSSRSTFPIKQNTRHWRTCSRPSRAGGSLRMIQPSGFDKEQCHHLVYAIVLLNASLHLGHLHVHQGLPATLAAFVGMVRSRGQRYTTKEELLEDIYEAIRQEGLLGPKDFPGHREVQVTSSISPMHFTVCVKSELIRVRIPESDANFRIHLLGQGLLFDPLTLHFPKSNEATSRVI